MPRGYPLVVSPNCCPPICRSRRQRCRRIVECKVEARGIECAEVVARPRLIGSTCHCKSASLMAPRSNASSLDAGTGVGFRMFECKEDTVEETEVDVETGVDVDGQYGWSKDEMEAITALFERQMPHKRARAKPSKERPLPIPSPYKRRLASVPTKKQRVRLEARSMHSSRAAYADRVCNNPDALVGIAREIAALPAEENVSTVLDRWIRFLRKGSLSMTIRELGHMGHPERALQTLCWAQDQDQRAMLFPDDRALASTVEVLARFGQLRVESELEKCLDNASIPVLEAMARGFIRAGKLRFARKIQLIAMDNRRRLDPSIHAKLIAAAGKTPDGYKLALVLLQELGEREDFDLTPQDCSAVMKVCIKLGKFELVESMFTWFEGSGKQPTVVMYTTMIYSRYCEKRYREGLALIWKMEELNLMFDLPAYRVSMRLFIALDDLTRASKYFLRLKQAGFVPTYDIFRDMIGAYAASGRAAKCRQLCKEAELAGVKLGSRMCSPSMQ